MYTELKDKSISRGLTVVTDNMKISRFHVAQVLGLRKSESARRNKLIESYNEQRNPKTKKLEEVRFNPLWNWTKQECDEMINHLGIVRNEYADRVGHSYECMCYANAVRGEREYRALISPKYEEIEKKRELIARLALEIQQLKIETGMIDPDDKIYLSSISVSQGWHLDFEIKEHSEEMNNPFVMCAACIPGQRSHDGKGGIDPDLEMKIHQLKKEQSMEVIP